MNLRQIFDATLANGGVTVDLKTGAILEGQPNSGERYAVALDFGQVLDFGTHPKDVPGAYTNFLEACAKLLLELRKDGHSHPDYIGTWIDGNVFYIDPVVLLFGIDGARDIARLNNQKAIYDLQTGTTLQVVPETR